MINIAREDLLYILQGAALLGSGGGGSLSAGKEFIRLMESGNYSLELVSEFSSQDTACVVCDIGAITSIESNQSRALINAFQALDTQWQQRQQRPLTAVMPIETGPENTLAALLVGALLGLPVYDGDGGGRAVPKLSLCSFASLAACPAVIANDKKDFLIVETSTAASLDDLLRPITASSSFGNSASLALWPGNAQQLARASVSGTISMALETGRLLHGLQKKDSTPIDSALSRVNELSGWLIGQGVVTDAKELVNGAFDFGQIIIEDSHQSARLTLLTQNENLIVYSSQSAYPLACAPDSIAYLTTSGEAITNSEIKVGDEVYVLGIQARPQLKQPLLEQGFQEILQQLGFSGSMNLPLPAYKPLGDLLKGLLIHPD